MRKRPSVAKNRAIRLQQELVALLRDTGSIEGAKLFWRSIDFRKGFGRKLACYGFANCQRQSLINKVAFPDLNFVEVDAALKAGKKLRQLYGLASGRLSIARDSNDRYEQSRKGLKLIAVRRQEPAVNR